MCVWAVLFVPVCGVCVDHMPCQFGYVVQRAAPITAPDIHRMLSIPELPPKDHPVSGQYRWTFSLEDGFNGFVSLPALQTRLIVHLLSRGRRLGNSLPRNASNFTLRCPEGELPFMHA